MKLRPLIFSVLVIMFAASGCLFSPDEGGGDGDTPDENPHIWPDTANKLIDNFKRYYSERDLEQYRAVLSRDFRFIAQDQTEYNYDREIGIANKMFNEIGGTDPDGNTIAFEDIEVVFLEPQDTWEATPETDPFFGGFTDSVNRSYDVKITFKVSGINLYYEVTGLVIFYVSSRQEDDGGTMRTRFELLGQQDATNG